MNDVTLPKYSSLKKSMISVFTAVATLKNETFDFTNNSLIVVTAAGIIYGTPCFSFSKDDIENNVFSGIYEQAKELTVSDSSEYGLILKDATLITSSDAKLSFNTLFVFPDDIIAITIGNVSNT